MGWFDSNVVKSTKQTSAKVKRVKASKQTRTHSIVKPGRCVGCGKNVRGGGMACNQRCARAAAARWDSAD